MLKKMISKPVDWIVYSMLDETQRKRIGDVLSKKHKERVMRLLNGRKFQQRRKLKALKHHLYNLGFEDAALKDLQDFLTHTENMEMRRLISWELSLWHANRNDLEGAKAAVKYLQVAAEGEESADQQRRIAIVTAECFDRMSHRAHAVAVLQNQLDKAPHPDLHLAMANLEDDIEARMALINKAFLMYDLAPIGFKAGFGRAAYDDLVTLPPAGAVREGPKVSVILPAFKAEEGIRVAIESILGQTWQNLELLVVDDCSPDATVETVKEYVSRDARVRLLSTPVNSGPYVARNIALKEATGEFVTINDADDWSHREKIETQVRHLTANPGVVANTSEHARLTEELKVYRRGTPGKYIFPNMSSIMFRKEEVLDEIGYWDSVRFAADGEFKRRLIKAFGQKSYVDLKSGPLSLPRQSVSSLTGSSAFGYDGFFMGVRKEYVESLEHHHDRAQNLYYPYPQVRRPFPVPEPMWPEREAKTDGYRNFDVVIAGDFRQNSTEHIYRLNRLKRQYSRIGLVQLYEYNLDMAGGISQDIRKKIDGGQVQALVYGEKIRAKAVIVEAPGLLTTWQKYRPEIRAEAVTAEGLMRLEPKVRTELQQRMEEYFGVRAEGVSE
ncbi:glycosyltransferase family 2 protein [Lacicoccus alkaliphilus]|uniref:Glycosyl transferase family 2 n=1 Tax=Lacicoccus alkaliphilus DSM 16010 TaxID=1123231 RepID=A0A1M7H6D5_9BACL|nr:glycosyltransferase family A protein [Salinicoccus alkaliphilus]SHM23916.1 Glycosyl transferase family 2 [Salinicoccus alkaliphilus DSM 16010]